MATLKEIASEAGVSIRTVRRVLNEDACVKPDKVKMVNKVIADIGYVPNLLARGLRNKNTGIIGIIADNLDLEVHVKKLSAVQCELREKGYGVMLGIASGNPDIEEKLVQEYSHFCDGIIFLLASTDQRVKVIKKITKPYVISDSYIKTVHAVSVDRDSGICEAIIAQHEKYRYISFIAATSNVNDRRKLAFEKCVQAAGVVDYNIIYCGGGDFNSGLLASESIISKKDNLLICYNDRVAAGVLKGLYAAGCNVPDDYGVIGFDNDDFTQYACQSISTITQSVDDLAKKTVKLLEHQIKGYKPKKVLSVNTKFISRETTK